jgi:hypothetical protein
MLLYEKYLLDKNKKYNFPVMEEHGIIAYEKLLDDFEKVFFVTFSKSNQKNNLTRYNFKFLETKIDSSNFNYVSNSSYDVEYQNYFEIFYDLRKKINNFNFNIAKTNDECFYLFWKSFVMVRDEWFSQNYYKIPFNLFDTINKKINIEERVDLIKKIINYLRVNFYQIYFNWVSHFSPYENLKNLNWFSDFVESQNV